MRELLKASRGEERCDLVIKGGRIANVLSLEIEEADVAIKDGIIVGVGHGYEGHETYDARGAYLIPGMIDGHIHIESSMLCPGEFARAVMPLGTTTVLSDPHEIANSCGVSGIEFITREAYATPLDLYFGAPSCVPASQYETPREEMDALVMMQCFYRDLCTHLGEMMNYPGVVAGDPKVWDKIESAYEMVRTGHAPGLLGKDLCAYMLSSCDCDHECKTLEEAKEKLRRGMWIMMREGSAEHNLQGLIRIVLEDEARFARCMAVSDDISAQHLMSKGHMDHKIRIMVSEGVRPIVALAMVTINPADYFRMYDRGAIAPGRIADIAVVESLEKLECSRVWKRGVLVAEDGKAVFEPAEPTWQTLPKIGAAELDVSPERLKVEAVPGKKARAIVSEQRQLVTDEMLFDPKIEGGCVVPDVDRDILKIVVVDKNSSSGRVGVGFVSGIGIKRGAVASSYSHDAHNIVAIGADDASISLALRAVIDMHGGAVCVDGAGTTASIPLQVGGLMSVRDAQTVCQMVRDFNDAFAALGSKRTSPLHDISFLTLSVIPNLKITDHGYVDLVHGGLKSIFEE